MFGFTKERVCFVFTLDIIECVGGSGMLLAVGGAYGFLMRTCAHRESVSPNLTCQQRFRIPKHCSYILTDSTWLSLYIVGDNCNMMVLLKSTYGAYNII